MQDKNTDDNLKLWDTVFGTDPKVTKPSQQGLTSISGQYFLMRATEMFGPCGIGWGYDIKEERIEEGVPIILRNGEDSGVKELNHTIVIELWYIWEKEAGRITGYGHTPYIQRTKWGASCDEEAPKKSLTDAIKKCLSMLGIGGDIHMGYFDSLDYQNKMRDKYALKDIEEAENDLNKRKNEFEIWIEKELASFRLLPSEHAVKTYYKSIGPKACTKAIEVGISSDEVKTRLKNAADEKINELKGVDQNDNSNN